MGLLQAGNSAQKFVPTSIRTSRAEADGPFPERTTDAQTTCERKALTTAISFVSCLCSHFLFLCLLNFIPNLHNKHRNGNPAGSSISIRDISRHQVSQSQVQPLVTNHDPTELQDILLEEDRERNLRPRREQTIFCRQLVDARPRHLYTAPVCRFAHESSTLPRQAVGAGACLIPGRYTALFYLPSELLAWAGAPILRPSKFTTKRLANNLLSQFFKYREHSVV